MQKEKRKPMEILKKAVAALTIVGVGVIGVVPANAQVSYTIQPGDTLTGIALSQCGDASRFSEIATLNNISDPNVIVAGQSLTLPDNCTGGTPTPTPTPTCPTCPTTTVDQSNLIDLIILSQLLNNENGNNRDFVELIILSELFSGNGLTTGSTFGGSNLIDLIILSELLNDNGGLFNN